MHKGKTVHDPDSTSTIMREMTGLAVRVEGGVKHRQFISYLEVGRGRDGMKRAGRDKSLGKHSTQLWWVLLGGGRTKLVFLGEAQEDPPMGGMRATPRIRKQGYKINDRFTIYSKQASGLLSFSTTLALIKMQRFNRPAQPRTLHLDKSLEFGEPPRGNKMGTLGNLGVFHDEGRPRHGTYEGSLYGRL